MMCLAFSPTSSAVIPEGSFQSPTSRPLWLFFQVLNEDSFFTSSNSGQKALMAISSAVTSVMTHVDSISVMWLILFSLLVLGYKCGFVTITHRRRCPNHH